MRRQESALKPSKPQRTSGEPNLVTTDTPVDPSDDLADYAPTQVLAELFKAHGFDGIAYRSSLGLGHNITLFDADDTDLTDCFLFEVKSLKFEFEQAANPYAVKEQETASSRHEGG